MKVGIFFIALFSINLLTKAQVMWQFKKDTVITWYYSDGDEFNGDKVDESIWNYWYGWARSIYSNKEQQYYTDGKNHILSNGTLKLSAVKSPITAKMVDWMKDTDTIKNNGKFYSFNKTSFAYQAGMLETKKTYVGGYFECRFKLPKEKGYWPAFWLHGGNPNEEIDIFEGKSERANKVHIDTHCPNSCDLVMHNCKKQSFGSWVKTKTNLVNDFNVLACEWGANEVKFYLNGEFIGISKVKFTVPKLITLNIAVPSDDGPFHPGPNKNDSSAVFEIDYVRVWDKKQSNLNSRILQNSNNYFTTIDTSVKPHKKTILRRKNKFYYGNKKDGLKEGIKITLFKNEKNYEFYVLGNIMNEAPVLTLLDSNNKQLKNINLKSLINRVSVSDINPGSYTFIVKWNTKNIKYPFQIN